MRPVKTSVCLVVLALLLAGCAPTPSAPEPNQEREQEQVTEPVASACDALTVDEVSAALGFDAPTGRPVSATVTQNDVAWTADRCRWKNEDMDVKVSISTADDFADGLLRCPVVSAKGQDGSEVAGLGESASFAFDDFVGSTAELRVCTATQLIDLSVETEAELDATSAQQSLAGLARLVLERL